MGNGVVRVATRAPTELPTPKTASSSSHTTASDTRSDAQRSNSPPIPVIKTDGYNNKFDPERLSLEDILGEPGSSTALYIKKKMAGRGAFGEAFIVENNPVAPVAKRRGRIGAESLAVNGTERVGDCQSRQFVAKVLNLTCMSDHDRQYAQTEIMCLANADHFAIVRYYEHFYIDDEFQTIVIITEFADKGDLYRNLHHMPSDRFPTEREAGVLFVQLLLGLDHVHRRRMIHRDIKTANIFLTSRGFLKLGDFGFSKQYDTSVSNPIAVTFLGTSYYLSPEMLKGQRYGKKADIWAAGIVLCELLGKRRPFEAHSPAKLKELVLSGDMWLPPTQKSGESNNSAANTDGKASPPCISLEMREFLEYILQLDPDRRPSASQLLKTPLMQHYLHLFKKQVYDMIAADDEVERNYISNPVDCIGDRRRYNLTAKERVLVMRGIVEGENLIMSETEKQIESGIPGHMEGVVFKGTLDGRWKERYLTLADGYLTVTLAKEKCASNCNTRSKRMPLDTIKSVSSMKIFYSPEANSVEKVDCNKKFVFVLSTVHSQSILFATKTEEERDRWLTALMFTLDMG
ncbi:serine/threonine-protein kinase, putative [Trypanosoma equiperdum]|uniref:non-specific serine/threonine protein kinase n=1 Tax=Trypanosoma equiperdum TaxID=5694 RepID=A0A1G4II00_TRYEQ|nr:serine/threonine-protein kinase, putative [Trypanosoma equiperdum]